MRSLVVLCLMAAGPCFAGDKNRDPSQIGHRNVAAGVNLYSRTREIDLGRELSRDIERESRLVEDPIICEYINRIGQNLANNSDTDFPVSVKVIRSADVNAFALPGGYVYVNSALVRAAENESELAGAIAHELGHVAARHYTREESLKTLIGLAGIPLVLFGGMPGFAIEQGLEVASPLAALKFSRSSEKQADVLGVQYLYRAGYDPLALVDFLERISVLQRTDPGTFAKMLAMHPPTASRIKVLQNEIDRNLSPRDEYVLQTSEFEAIQKRLATIESGTYVPWKYPRPPVVISENPPVLKRQ